MAGLRADRSFSDNLKFGKRASRGSEAVRRAVKTSFAAGSSRVTIEALENRSYLAGQILVLSQPVAPAVAYPATVMSSNPSDVGEDVARSVSTPISRAIPTFTTITPTTGPTTGGTSVTITGTNLTGATAVDFGALPATSFTVVSDTQITAITPAESAGTVDVTVTTAGGTSTISSADQFTFTAAMAAPTVTAVAPTSGPTTGGTAVTITGTNFTGATGVKFGTVAATNVTVVSATEITATTPAHAAATVNVTVTTPSGTSATSIADQFTFLTVTPAPTVVGIAPTTGTTAGGTTVTITGTGFTGATAVAFGSDPAASFTVVSDTEITAVTPAEAAGTVNVTVTTSGGTSATSVADDFTFVIPPQTFVVINSFDENGSGGAVAGSLRAAIIAANADPGSTITFDPTTVTTPIVLQANLPAITAEGTFINGTTGQNGTVEISGTGVTTAAFDVKAADVVIEGLEIGNCIGSGAAAAIELDAGSSDCLIIGNDIGMLVNGTAEPDGTGILVTNGSVDNTIGGTTASERNVIGNTTSTTTGGIDLTNTNGNGTGSTGTSGNTIEGNYIGLSPSGLEAEPQDIGILLSDTTGNVIEKNYISGNTADGGTLSASGAQSGGFGILTQDPTSSGNENGNTIEENKIGVNIDSAAVPNNVGISLSNLPAGLTGDLVSGNTISDNNDAGVQIAGSDNVVSTNSISSNGGAGVLVLSTGQRNTISQNSFTSNGTGTGPSAGLAIDLNGDGVTSNSSTGGTSANGANGDQSYPVLTATAGATTTSIGITLQSNPNTTYTIELFTNTAASTSATGHGQALAFVENLQVVTGSTGFVTTSVTIPNSLLAANVTATATNASAYNAQTNVEAGATSEFALNVATPAGTSGGATTAGNTGIALHVGNSFTLKEIDPVLYKSDAFFVDYSDTGGPYTATANYGDGTGLQVVPFNSNDQLSLIHAFDGHVSATYVVTVNVYDSTSDSKHTFDVTIINNPPHDLTITPVKQYVASTSVPYEAQASFLDSGAGKGDAFRVYVNYGDGTHEFKATTGRNTFRISHQYTHPGTYKLTVTVIDSGDGEAIATTEATILAPTKKKT